MIIESTFWATVLKLFAIIGVIAVVVVIVIAILLKFGWDLKIELYK